MKRPTPSFAIAACLSAAVHVGLLVVLPRYGGTGYSRATDSNRKPFPPPLVIEEPELPKVPLPEFEMGEKEGKGYASQSVDAPNEATAPEAPEDQAYLGLDPPGSGERRRAAAAAALAEATGNPAAQSLTPFGMTTGMKLPRPTERPAEDRHAPTAGNEALAIIGPSAQTTTSDADGSKVNLPSPPTPETRDAQPPVEAAASPQQQQQQQPSPSPAPPTAMSQASTPSQPGGAPARLSDSESDPFSKLGTVTFTDGALQVRFGRKVKTRKPKILLAGQLDLFTLRRASVQLKIDIDSSGKVTTVAVTKSSGSNDIDQPTRVAVYDWEFEPKTDAAGSPIPDQLQFTINWR